MSSYVRRSIIRVLSIFPNVFRRRCSCSYIVDVALDMKEPRLADVRVLVTTFSRPSEGKKIDLRTNRLPNRRPLEIQNAVPC